MKWDRSIEILQVHCQGEIGKVIIGGAPDIPGATALEKMNHINTVDDSFRKFVTFEPRASAAMTMNLLIAPTRADADAGFIVLQADRAHAMSGSNCICVVTALLESGRVKMVEPETIVRLDTPAGLITARAHCSKGRCLSVGLDNVPAFVQALDVTIGTPRWGRHSGRHRLWRRLLRHRRCRPTWHRHRPGQCAGTGRGGDRAEAIGGGADRGPASAAD